MSLHPRRRRTKLQWASIFLLAAVWILLWGDISWANLLGGLVVGILVTVLLPLPPVDFHGRVRPGALLYLFFRFIWDLAVASVHVAALALNFRKTPRGAVVGVQLRNHSDLYLTITAELSTLTPGSLVVEARRLTGMLYLHVLDIESYGGAEKVREDTWALEERVLRAFASDAELEEAGLPVRPVLNRIRNGVNGRGGRSGADDESSGGSARGDDRASTRANPPEPGPEVTP